MPSSPRKIVSFMVVGTLGTASLVGAHVVTAGPALAADVNCPSANAPSLSGGVYQVDDSSHLMWIRDDSTRWDDSYVLTQDIDMGTCVWDSPIAPLYYTGNAPFSGFFDGDGHTIDNLTVEVDTKSLDDSQANLAAFIGYMDGGGRLESVTFDHALVTLDDTTDYDDSLYNSANVKVAIAVAYANDAVGVGSSLLDITVANSTAQATLADVRVWSAGTRWRYSIVGGVAGEVWSDDVSGLVTSNNVIRNLNYQTTGLIEAQAGGIIGTSNGEMSDLTSTDDSVTSSGRYAPAGGVIGEIWRGSVTDATVIRPDVLSLSVSEAHAGGAFGSSYGDGVERIRVQGGSASAQPAAANPYGWFQAGGAMGETVGYTVDVQVTGTAVTASGRGFVNAGGAVGLAYDDTMAQVTSDADAYAYSTGDDTSYVGAGGLVGWFWGDGLTDSYATGDAVAWTDDTDALAWAGGLVGYVDSGSISDSYATGSATATSTYAGLSSAEAGGLVGASEGDISRSYSTGTASATAGSGDDTVGGLIGTQWAGTTTDSYWNVTTSGVSTSDGGTGLTSAQMQDSASFAGWTVVDGWQAQTYSGSPALPTSPFWGQCDVNSGFPFLLWQYSADPCAVPPPPPPPTYPPSAPRDVTAVAGDGSAVVSWSVPVSSGSFPVSTYQVTDESGEQTCMYSVAADADLSCEYSDLSNGESYRFRVRALNGAGWGSWSDWSQSVTPEPGPAILVTGSREGRFAKVAGTSTGLVSETVQSWVKLRGQPSYAEGSRPLLDGAGDFTWQRKTGKKVYVYFRADGVKSNRLIIDSRP